MLESLQKATKSLIVPSVEAKLDAAFEGRDLNQEVADTFSKAMKKQLEEAPARFKVGDISVTPDGVMHADIKIRPVTSPIEVTFEVEREDAGGDD
jgi:hypothetical protein